MLAAWYKKQMEAKAREQGREEGRSEVKEMWLEWLKRWEEWDQRRADAKKEGAPFAEPRPDSPGENSSSTEGQR